MLKRLVLSARSFGKTGEVLASGAFVVLAHAFVLVDTGCSKRTQHIDAIKQNAVAGLPQLL